MPRNRFRLRRVAAWPVLAGLLLYHGVLAAFFQWARALQKKPVLSGG